ncbi:LXG domain-containing protein [Lactococcus lactis]|uniref:LXG domain-containing protein n=1 Tax=Lactococcus lactis TaxID=1358 RepID=UPI00206ECEEF|nr:LXG domain-containing protein [Lactococcus lactis]BDH84663.1 hypothetical protein LLID5_19480 [Lactococcus lactis]
MVIYNSGDSDQLINSMTSNLQTAKEVFSRLDKGSRHLDFVIDSGTLSGAAYKAGQTMFQTYIFPMIKQLNSAIDDIQNDLTSYKAADSQIKSVSNRIDEDHVKAMLANTNQLIALVEQKMRDDKDLIKSFTEKGLSGVITGLSELPGLEGQLDNLKSLKHDYQKQLEAIQTFSFSTNSLFTDSLEAFKYAMQGVEIINQSKASVDGTITFSAGADMSWSSKLQAEKFSSQPTEKDKLLQKYANDPKTLKSIEELSKSMGTSLEDAEKLFISLHKVGDSQKDLAKLKINLSDSVNEFKLQNPGLGEMSAWEFLAKLSSAGLFTIAGIEMLLSSGAIESSSLAEKLLRWVSKADEVGGDLTEEDIFSSERIYFENGEEINVNAKPNVENPKLNNIIKDLYKGQSDSSPNTIGNGTTMDAVRNEKETGEPTNGYFHTEKLENSLRALERRLRANNLNEHDTNVVEALIKDIKNALEK